MHLSLTWERTVEEGDQKGEGNDRFGCSIWTEGRRCIMRACQTFPPGPTNGRTTRPNFLGQIDPSVLTVVRKGICHCTLSKVGWNEPKGQITRYRWSRILGRFCQILYYKKVTVQEISRFLLWILIQAIWRLWINQTRDHYTSIPQHSAVTGLPETLKVNFWRTKPTNVVRPTSLFQPWAKAQSAAAWRRCN